MKMKEFKNLTAEELSAKVEEFRKEKFVLRGQAKSGQLENPAKIRTTRRDLARALTEQKLRASK